MPKRSNSFQDLVSLIERQLAPTTALVTESAMVPETLTDKGVIKGSSLPLTLV